MSIDSFCDRAGPLTAAVVGGVMAVGGGYSTYINYCAKQYLTTVVTSSISFGGACTCLWGIWNAVYPEKERLKQEPS